MKRIGIALVMFAFTACTFASVAFATGYIVLISDTWDELCEVETVSGPNAPGRGYRQSWNDVVKGDSFTFEDKVCYRRPAQPPCSDNWSGWVCCQELIDGDTQQCQLH